MITLTTFQLILIIVATVIVVMVLPGALTIGLLTAYRYRADKIKRAGEITQPTQMTAVARAADLLRQLADDVSQEYRLTATERALFFDLVLLVSAANPFSKEEGTEMLTEATSHPKVQAATKAFAKQCSNLP